MFTLNSKGGKIRIDASASGRPSATDARLAPLSAGDSVWLGWLARRTAPMPTTTTGS